jgi:hypothetical protein
MLASSRGALQRGAALPAAARSAEMARGGIAAAMRVRREATREHDGSVAAVTIKNDDDGDDKKNSNDSSVRPVRKLHYNPDYVPARSNEVIRTPMRRLEVIHDPYLNRGTAFSSAERERLGLRGLVPPRRQYLEVQVQRIMQGLDAMTSPIGTLPALCFLGLACSLARNDAAALRARNSPREGSTQRCTSPHPRVLIVSRALTNGFWSVSWTHAVVTLSTLFVTVSLSIVQTNSSSSLFSWTETPCSST